MLPTSTNRHTDCDEVAATLVDLFSLYGGGLAHEITERNTPVCNTYLHTASVARQRAKGFCLMHERLGACQFFLGSIRGKRREREGERKRETGRFQVRREEARRREAWDT